MADKTFSQVYKTNFIGHWGKISDIRKPIIAAVNGFAVCVCFFYRILYIIKLTRNYHDSWEVDVNWL